MDCDKNKSRRRYHTEPPLVDLVEQDSGYTSAYERHNHLIRVTNVPVKRTRHTHALSLSKNLVKLSHDSVHPGLDVLVA